ncbi:NADP oxidoreductase [Formosimonas limnophila]|uniref:NADP oxidoreductase n=1 Tax=Formosimonas limnophila TaxID=1384487 RepID=A0A8J3CLM0_9BURK|nr:NADPH-dependent F420 reductase [Formosimonas limnophila]GHA66453.1 NADP oxidoreductase [Formosimonas limnophila]
MNITFIGYGNVGAPLADHLQKLGHNVTLAARDTQSDAVQKVQARNAQIKAAPIEQAVREADIVFLATPYSANADIMAPLADALAGKIIVDCTNPVGAGLSHGLNSAQSGSEALQALAPRAKVVKAFTIYGFENFENNAYPAYNVKPVMMYCGDDAEAKQTVGGLIEQLGWQPLDVGGLVQALHLEHMTLLWVRMVRMNGANPNMVWAMITR